MMHPLEPDPHEMEELGSRVLEHLVGLAKGVADRPVRPYTTMSEVSDRAREFLTRPPEDPGDLTTLLDRLDQATADSVELASPGFMAYIGGGGLYSSALGEFYARTVNRFGGDAFEAPLFTALEESVLRWMARDVCGLPAGSSGLLTTGGSMAALSAVVAARYHHLGEDIGGGTVYLTQFAHHSISKAARLAGIRQTNIRVVPVTRQLRMDVEAAEEMIAADRQAGLRPFLLVGSAGTTDTGTVDPLHAIADLAGRERLWFHADAAYGGFFGLTGRGRRVLAGIERADSVTLDPHKTLFLGCGTGALVVRNPATLAAAHGGTSYYLRDVEESQLLPDYATISPELTREIRGVRVWLPLHLHGVAAFRAALDERLDLTEYAHARLLDMPELEVPWRPDLSVLAFRMRPRGEGRTAALDADAATQRLLERVNARHRAFLSSTLIDGRVAIRIAIVSHRVHRERVTELLDLIADAAAEARLDTTGTAWR
jgi:aromatic-L-amino-acid/L-tryptophan decarboxylase